MKPRHHRGATAGHQIAGATGGTAGCQCAAGGCAAVGGRDSNLRLHTTLLERSGNGFPFREIFGQVFGMIFILEITFPTGQKRFPRNGRGGILGNLESTDINLFCDGTRTGFTSGSCRERTSS